MTQMTKDRRHYKQSSIDKGCPLWVLCFSCPGPDCVWEIGASLKRQKEIIETWGEFFEKARG